MDLILDKIEKKNKAFRKYMNSRATEIKEQLKTDYKNIKNEITNLTRQSKKDNILLKILKIYKKSGKESRKSLISKLCSPYMHNTGQHNFSAWTKNLLSKLILGC